MTRDELVAKLKDVEWDDFEAKEAASELPKSVWETVSAFSNASGGWIVLGVRQTGKKFEITGVKNPEKVESDFLNVVRGGQKLSQRIAVTAKKHKFRGKTVLTFFVPSSPVKPVYIQSLQNTFLRSGSGDRRAGDMEINAMFRDQAFGTKSEQLVDGSSIAMLDPHSLETYRNRIANVNPQFPYNELKTREFCEKTGISRNGRLTYGGLLMLGNRDDVLRHVSNFWIDMLEIPGTRPGDADPRYTFRMPEQANIWEYYNALIQRLRLHVDAPFTAGPDGFAPDDDSELYALREGLVNMLAHADYFSPMHSTVRVFADRIEFQNAGRFMFDLKELKKQLHSMPRNPVLIKLFRFAKLGENAGYGIDKMLTWEKLTHSPVEFASDLVCSTVTYRRKSKIEPVMGSSSQNDPVNGPVNDPVNDPVNLSNLSPTAAAVLNAVKAQNAASMVVIAAQLHISPSTVKRALRQLKEAQAIERVGSDKSGHWEVK